MTKEELKLRQEQFRKETEIAKFEAFSLMCQKVAELENESRVKENCWNCAYFKEKKYQACIDIKKNNTKRCAFYKWELAE